MTTLREAAQQALEALEYYEHQKFEWGYADEAAITALRAALAQQQEQEQWPVAYLWQHSETGRTRVVMPDQVVTADATWVVVGPLYLHPPRREWRGLSEEERADILFPLTAAGDSDMECARAIEQACKERNT
jgi:hypothetical protein